ncbi:hypothetical protein C8J57DRAFT_1705647 [Mycena rebaudengoi]|nr:hypothetical protein C8J57DRAFT_1705647 [Mycena rebaudengoi]
MSPKLPPELECQIFETAARDCRDNFESTQVTNLCLIARRVHFWVEPILLEVVALWDGNHAKKFLKLVHMKPEGFLAKAVRILCISYQVDVNTASKIVSVCTGVPKLASWTHYERKPEPSLPFLISQLPLTRLAIASAHFSIILDEYPSCVWLSTLTHLELSFWWTDDGPASVLSLSRLPRLTHVTLASGNMVLARALCSSCPNLQLVRVGPCERAADDDPRIVTYDTYSGDVYSYMKEWLRDPC